jgi:hypothetical protein
LPLFLKGDTDAEECQTAHTSGDALRGAIG